MHNPEHIREGHFILKYMKNSPSLEYAVCSHYYIDTSSPWHNIAHSGPPLLPRLPARTTAHCQELSCFHGSWMGPMPIPQEMGGTCAVSALGGCRPGLFPHPTASPPNPCSFQLLWLFWNVPFLKLHLRSSFRYQRAYHFIDYIKNDLPLQRSLPTSCLNYMQGCHNMLYVLLTIAFS